ncbi:Dabb family protein (plasmid) [Bradyrhizobium sp. ISRA443]|uniref:Dabb family protein n=1 Tax=unclassified Bradyrhizobium TaxID=2631580 RepID=UPI002479E059|nr:MULTISPECIES: Dabb family protein [unclassified Bradyrhizobium]WGR90844.1 Dabb family protein [Bradyrhizobium sp. ISRA435]WGS03022.1 Dabb family protein [Bradyrhizobium sp. ISRA436]WGS09943.1 Dabb family protein [Bradyrhizobium sp. ISRA437]WGS16828.1 Dabb family protein [Bradyrhizobium sp. ISRA443]
MIRHIVLFSAKDETQIDQIVERLAALATIPHARRLEIARNRKTDPVGSNAIDVVVYAEFNNETELAAYKSHGLYQGTIRLVRPLQELRFAADYAASASLFSSTGGMLQLSRRPRRA